MLEFKKKKKKQSVLEMKSQVDSQVKQHEQYIISCFERAYFR